MVGTTIAITIGLSVIGAVMAAVLLIVFVNSYRRVRAPFTLSLILVAFFFLMQNLLWIYAFWTMMADFTDLVMNMMIAIIALGDVALGLLLYSSWK
jgi:hypothetical protein